MLRAVLLLAAAALLGATSHYDTLGVSPDADLKVLRKAYRALALTLHPDKRGANATEDVIALFHEVTRAYETLSDLDRRAEYDADLASGTAGGGSAVPQAKPVGDAERPYALRARLGSRGFFSLHYGGAGVDAAEDAHAQVSSSIAQLYHARTANLTYARRAVCEACAGTGHAGHGAPDAPEPPSCPLCGGSGRAEHSHGEATSHFTQTESKTCRLCGGNRFVSDKGCTACGGRGTKLEPAVPMSVDLPAGAPDGLEIILKGRGHQHPHRRDGNLAVVHNTIPHGNWRRDEANLERLAEVPLVDALTGFRKFLRLPDGSNATVFHSATNSTFADFEITLPGRGLPVFPPPTAAAAEDDFYGDVIVRCSVQVPKFITDDEYKLLRRFMTRSEVTLLSRIIHLMALAEGDTAYADAQCLGPPGIDTDPDAETGGGGGGRGTPVDIHDTCAMDVCWLSGHGAGSWLGRAAWSG